MTSFFAIRPMTTTGFVLIKFLAALVSAAIVWGIIVALFAFWTVLEASSLNPHESFVRAAWAKATPQGIAVVVGVLIGFLALMWRNIVIGMWPTLTGRKWIFNAIGIWTLIEFSLLGIAGAYVYRHPEIQRRLVELVPWVIGGAVTLKLGAAAGVIAALHRQGVVEPRVTGVFVAIWCGVCVGLFVVLCLIGSPTLLLAAGIVLFVPLTRLAAAPLALHWNRHR